MKILYLTDAWDAATVTVSSEVSSDLSGDNLLDPRIDTYWRTTGDASETAEFDLTDAEQITAIGIPTGNLTADATVTLRANSSSSWGAAPFVEVLPMPVDVDGVVEPVIGWYGDETYRYWQLSIQDAANPDGYLQLPRVIGGVAWEPTRNYSAQFVVTLVDPSLAIGEEDGAQPFWKEKKRHRVVDLSFRIYAQAQADKLYAFARRIGKRQPILIGLSPDTEPSSESLYCTMRSNLAQIHRVVNTYDTAGLQFGELVE